MYHSIGHENLMIPKMSVNQVDHDGSMHMLARVGQREAHFGAQTSTEPEVGPAIPGMYTLCG